MKLSYKVATQMCSSSNLSFFTIENADQFTIAALDSAQ